MRLEHFTGNKTIMDQPKEPTEKEAITDKPKEPTEKEASEPGEAGASVVSPLAQKPHGRKRDADSLNEEEGEDYIVHLPKEQALRELEAKETPAEKRTRRQLEVFQVQMAHLDSVVVRLERDLKKVREEAQNNLNHCEWNLAANITVSDKVAVLVRDDTTDEVRRYLADASLTVPIRDVVYHYHKDFLEHVNGKRYITYIMAGVPSVGFIPVDSTTTIQHVRFRLSVIEPRYVEVILYCRERAVTGLSKFPGKLTFVQKVTEHSSLPRFQCNRVDPNSEAGRVVEFRVPSEPGSGPANL